ncbi:alpha/beta hydrolase [Gulosibacter chungangensis]|uniref:Alpha/beta hydrolase n=1 Tax=Gulosibacter chungangensis TaxID=979746 RepID=A0A7J5BGS2_9MICO|nr:alpha/beta hydrolase [Gulosibacter chungangensis]KAB1644820.1 alpha/beta hydrolase [Gulosibacter chungangensis]
MTAHSRRKRGRLLAAGAMATVATMALSGCVMIQELTAPSDPSDSSISPNERGEAQGKGDLYGDLDAALVEYYEQSAEWGVCPADRAYPDEVECATVSAPMNWQDPEEHEPIELALVRLPATGQAQGSMFTNPGGPGGSGTDFVGLSGDYFFSADLRENFDIVGWDPRGVGYSSAVECRDDAGMDDFLYGVPENAADMTDEEAFEWWRQQAAQFGADCLENTGPLLEYVDTQSTVSDLDMLRAIVGDTSLTYFGLSYGTDIGAQYIDRFPDRVGRIVLDGATDPTVPMFDVVVDQQEKFADATLVYLEDCLTGADCPFNSGGGVDGVIDEIQAIMDEVDETLPVHTDGRIFTSGVIQTAISAALYSEDSWPYLTAAFEAWMQDQDPSVFFALSDSYYGRMPDGSYDSNMFEAFPAINCLDYPLVTDEGRIRDYNERLADVTLFGGELSELEMQVGDLTCENWPVKSRVESQEPVTGAGAAPVLVVATTNDPATPLKWAEAVAEQLESGVLVEFEGEGHIAYSQGDACIVSTVDDYFIDGTVPEYGLTC